MRRFVLGTAGHVDHGKTTLVRALTGVDTDRLPEEKRRGITIELGFAPWQVDAETFASVIDVPGHRRLVHTMIAGAAGIELVLLVVAADEGVMPQTREHIAACQLLGITRAVVAITKLDRVERELAKMAGEEVSELLQGRFEHETVLCSAKSGEGIAELGVAVGRALRTLTPRAASKYAQLSIDRAFSVKGAGTVVTGTLVRGALKIGDGVVLVGRRGARAASVRGLHVHDAAATEALAPTRLAINLAGVALEDVTRGDLVTSDRAAEPTKRFDAELLMMAQVKSAAALDVYVGTARSPARLQLLRAAEALEDGTVLPALGRLRLERSLGVVGGDRFVLRGGSTKSKNGAVVGGGVVLDARPPPMREKKTRRAVLDALRGRDLAVAARALCDERAPRPLLTRDLAGRFAVDAQAIERAADKLADRGEIARVKDEGFISRDALVLLAARARSLARQYHLEHPLDRGIKLETLRQKLAERTSAGAAQEAIRFAGRKALEGEPLLVEGDVARIEGFVEGGTLTGGGPLDRVLAALLDAGLKGMGEFAIAEVARGAGKEVRAILAKLVRDGRLVTVGEQWFDARAVQALRERVIAHFGDHAVLTIAEFKALSGLGRKQAIPLLELFDREGTSVRKGDDRVPGKALAPAPAKDG